MRLTVAPALALLLTACGGLPKCPAEALRIPVVTRPLGDDISGLLVTSEDGTSRIFLNRGEHKHRRRFTLAHEIGHSVLRHQDRSGEHVFVDRGFRVSRRDKRASEGVDSMEIEANAFAAALLMPEQLLRKLVNGIDGDVLEDRHISMLAEKCDVSEQAMVLRLTALDLVAVA